MKNKIKDKLDSVCDEIENIKDEQSIIDKVNSVSGFDYITTSDFKSFLNKLNSTIFKTEEIELSMNDNGEIFNSFNNNHFTDIPVYTNNNKVEE
jgi:hypothetical protein